MVITGRSAVAAAFAAVLIALAPAPAEVFVVASIALALAIGADVALAGSPAALRFTRSGRSTVRLGEPGRVELTVANEGRRVVRGRIRDAWPPSLQAGPRQQDFDLAPGDEWTAVTEVRPTRRGDQDAAAVTVRSVGPLGLAGRQRTTTVPARIRVLPPFLSRRHLPSRTARLRELDGNLPVATRGRGSEFDSLREYIVGDDVRSIDWRATARRTEVMVRTWRPERDRHVVIVLDTGRTSAGRIGVGGVGTSTGAAPGAPGGWPRLDWSMDAALLLAAVASQAGDHVDLLAYDREVRAGVFGATRARLLADLADAMAPVQPALAETDAVGLVGMIASRVRRDALLVLLTDLNDAAMDRGLLPVLPQLTAGRPVIVAAVSDPRVTELARARGDAAAVYAAAAAERARTRRAALAERVRRCGADVIDAAPDELAPVLTDRYLALKFSRRL